VLSTGDALEVEKSANMNRVKKNEAELDAIRGRSGDVLGHPTSLILVAGHAIVRRLDSLESDEGWFLKHFQAGEAKSYIEHVRHGVILASGEPDAILLFAGGQTDSQAGPRSESQGYWLVADHFDWFGHRHVIPRASTEEFSMDSFENLLFGLCRFKELTGSYPENLTVVGWNFKRYRFEMHRVALHFPLHRFRYEGVGDPPDLATNQHFEGLRRAMFKDDPFGQSEEAARKKRVRNFSCRQHGYHKSCPEITSLLDGQVPTGREIMLPWGE